jgi:hypothetical protein
MRLTIDEEAQEAQDSLIQRASKKVQEGIRILVILRK